MAGKPAVKKTAAAKTKKEAAPKVKKAAASKVELPAAAKRFLHVGCGALNKEQTTKGFAAADWHETRLDIDKSIAPHIVASMADLSTIETATYDALFSRNAIQHLYVHEVSKAFAEFARVLKPDGFAVISCPDLQSVGAVLAQNHLMAALYNSPEGPMTALDILYGRRASVGSGKLHMAHHCGFTKDVLGATMASAGFASIASLQRAHPHYDLWLVAEHFPV